ncbi:MAG TPA: cupin domain-containing protein [Vicinamibacterales bacterium]|nr:cupin domain-containing protein [Vicinamibacterales bacterium]
MLAPLCLVMLSAASPAAATAPPRAAATVDVLVTDRRGRPLPSARVVIDGVSEREGVTNTAGHIIFRNMTPGAYKLQVVRETYITFEKEFEIRTARGSLKVSAALSPTASLSARAPKKTPEAPKPASQQGPQIVSLPDLAEKQLAGRGDVKESPIGCSGATGARLIQVEESLTDAVHAGAEQMIYIVAGEGELTVGGKRGHVKPGMFTIIPRGTSYGLDRKGRKPVVLLSVVGGQPCGSSPVAARAAR